MIVLNQYRLLENVDIDEREILLFKEKSDIIIELSEEGIVHIWPLSPAFKNQKPLDDEAKENQDLADYLVDGDWAVSLPWMYFNNMNDVMVLLNRNEISLSYRDLGSFSSIRAARASLGVSFS